MNSPIVRFLRLEHAGALPLPAYASKLAAGIDLRAAIDKRLMLSPGNVARIPTGFAIELPEGHEGQVRARSGWALRGLIVVNGPGTIDQDFRGELQVLAGNIGHEPLIIERGDRIAQLVIAPVIRAQIIEAVELSETGRGENGFGSTGR